MVFVGTFVFRFTQVEFDNDHFRMMTQGQQVATFGELPVRDFDDPGIFLQIFTSAALQKVFGYNLLGQAVFDVLILSLAAAITYYLASSLARSNLLGLLVTALAVVMYPRLKQHQVVFLPVLGLLVCYAYADRPTRRRLALLGLTTALAFLLRHDQGIYTGIAATVTLLAVWWRRGLLVLFRQLGSYTVIAALPVVPFLIFLQVNGGIVEYFQAASDYIRSEASRQEPLRRPDFTVVDGAPLFAFEPAPPREINVRWEPQVTAETRLQLEDQYHLGNPRRLSDGPRGSTWTYELLDASEDNLRRLVKDRRVGDTDGVDRKSFRFREPLLVQWRRTIPLLGIRLAPGLLQPANALPWLYHLFVGVPITAIMALLMQRARCQTVPDAAKILATAVLALAIVPSIRAPLPDRLADSAAPIAILSAWLLRNLLGKRSSRPTDAGTTVRRRADMIGNLRIIQMARLSVAVLLVGMTWLSITASQGFWQRVGQASTLPSPLDIVHRFHTRLTRLGTSPPSHAPFGISPRLLTLARYVAECTRPADRLLVTWFAPELYFYSGRGLAGRQLFWFPGYASSDIEQQRTLEKLRAHRVPIIVHRRDRDTSVVHFPLIQRYITEHYQVAWQDSSDSGEIYEVLVDQRLTPSSMYKPLGLPCYRA